LSRLRVCAVLRARPSLLPPGPSGGEIRLLECGPLVVAAEVEPADLPVSAEALAAHDRVVRLLGDQVDAVLPARFGWIAEEATLGSRLDPHRESLLEALDLTAGREQMTLRLYGAEGPGEAGEPPLDGPPSGTAYLERKRDEARRRREVREIGPLREALQGLVRAERAERRAPTERALDRAFARVHHLVDRGRAADYRRVVAATAPRLVPVRATVSGPWPPYAYAPADLA
jgi:Gas vesicle synthesis protein GvpL/GvpF